MKRRLFLKTTLAGSALTTALGAGLLTPQSVLAAWPKKAMGVKDVNEALTEALGSAGSVSEDIHLDVPDVAENGGQVKVVVDASALADVQVQSIAILVNTNTRALAAVYHVKKAGKPYVSTRVKMADSGDIVVGVKTDNGVKITHKTLKVAAGGC